MAEWTDSLPAIEAGTLPSTFSEAADQARTDGRLSPGLRRHAGRCDRQRSHNARRQTQADRMLETLPAAARSSISALTALSTCATLSRGSSTWPANLASASTWPRSGSTTPRSKRSRRFQTPAASAE